MTIDVTGQGDLLEGDTISIRVEANHPLMLLGNALPWKKLMDLVVSDLKNTTPNGFWFLGRKIKVRMHLGAYFLQRIYNLTDRKLEYQIKDNAPFQIFCGLKIVDGWHAPDHTKIETFRNRLSPETHRALANSIAQVSVGLGFGDPREVDFDSTVQEANMAYPSDASIMCKLAGLGRKLTDYLCSKYPKLQDVQVDLKEVKEKARAYFFLAKNKAIEIRRDIFKKLHMTVKQQMRPVVNLCDQLSNRQIADLPWNIRQAFDQITGDGWRYLLDVGYFTRTNMIKAGKILSLHAKEVACIKKGKVGKEFEFGRVFQLGRIKGNFLFVLESTSLQMNDKHSFIPFLEQHVALFGQGNLETVAVDKGYWSAKNQKALKERGLVIEGLQKPSNLKVIQDVDTELQEDLLNRRAGIEPLIGHAKQGGQLGKSRMKSDTATLAAGYGSVLGLNMRQLIRCQQKKSRVVA